MNIHSLALALALEKIQKRILKLVTEQYPEVYLVGGTALGLLYRHRVSEDLDFFSQRYTRRLHRKIAAHIGRMTRYPHVLIAEEARRKFVNMAVYEFRAGRNVVLKVDFVKDFAGLIKPVEKNGIASIEDIYFRKILAVIGLSGGESRIGKQLAGGRQKAKDLFDIFYLSNHGRPLSGFFSQVFDQGAYERLTAWYLGVPKQRTMMELLELAPGCDPRAVFKHLDDEIIYKLNREYTGI